MNFEDMQVIWNQQNERPLYAIDEAAMARWVQKEGRSVARWINFEELVMSGALVVAGLYLVGKML